MIFYSIWSVHSPFPCLSYHLDITCSCDPCSVPVPVLVIARLHILHVLYWLGDGMAQRAGGHVHLPQPLSCDTMGCPSRRLKDKCLNKNTLEHWLSQAFFSGANALGFLSWCVRMCVWALHSPYIYYMLLILGSRIQASKRKEYAFHVYIYSSQSFSNWSFFRTSKYAI